MTELGAPASAATLVGAPDPVRLARALLACPSVTPDASGALDVLERALAAAGFTVERPVFTAPGTPDVENLFATIGTGGRHLAFAGHVDVVPTGPVSSWTHPPFAAEVEGGTLYGRGAVDMKGGVAAFAAAAAAYVADQGGASGLRGRLSFLITGDEEGPAVNGTAKLLAFAAARGHRFDACVVGEPTSVETLGDTIKIGRRGSLSGTLTIRGRQGHVAYPHRAENPARALPRFLEALMAPLDGGTDVFEPSNLEVTGVETPTRAFNLIPPSAEIRFNARFNDCWSGATLKTEIARRCAGAAERAGAMPVPYALAFEEPVSDVFLTRSDALIEIVASAIRTETGLAPALSTGGGTSDARFVKDYCPVVEFGLVGTTMHQVDERVPVAELVRLTAIYRRIIDVFLA